MQQRFWNDYGQIKEPGMVSTYQMWLVVTIEWFLMDSCANEGKMELQKPDFCKILTFKI